MEALLITSFGGGNTLDHHLFGSPVMPSTPCAASKLCKCLGPFWLWNRVWKKGPPPPHATVTSQIRPPKALKMTFSVAAVVLFFKTSCVVSLRGNSSKGMKGGSISEKKWKIECRQQRRETGPAFSQILSSN